jgi:hypothetical protein
MPIIDNKEMSPDEAILLGHCPECGQLLIPKTAVAHASSKHWFGRDPNDPWLSEEARRRYKLIIDFAAARYNPALEERESHRRGVSMSEPIVDRTPASHDTRAYWIDQLIAVAIIGVGQDFRHDYPAPGYITMAVGFVWLVYLRWEHKPMTPQIRTPNFLAVAVLFLATLVVGYDIYDRHHPSGGDAASWHVSWDATTPLEIVYGSQRAFVDETVQLDGKHFIDPAFENVTFVYEGTQPFVMDSPKFILRPGQLGGMLTSHNPIVTQTIEIMQTLDVAAGCNNSGTLFRPPGSK